ncbi:hypothetical protein KVT40_007479 [Elsinoe batatas]|uniref:Methyltransferase-domain-containing protein n=1 Tax=Elsinoe batatas TaxID=2601811 RepID=A0A8K0KW60_9PEZI|nr:hypothetical protein KVT40_007479 [Elsinoe batatas]
MEIHDEVKTLVRQILQLIPAKDLRWPSPDTLRSSQNQQFIYTRCFDTANPRTLGPGRYRYSVLKPLVRNIENAIVDPEEDEISDQLLEALSELMVEEMPSEMDAARQQSWVTYATSIDGKDSDIAILESRSVISGSGTTGLRTWEAALHLGSYLLTSKDSAFSIRGKHILELGAGTGLLSILCGKTLQASKVLSTDGSEEVVDSLKTNIQANTVESVVTAGVLRWGWHLKDTLLAMLDPDDHIDTVLGADVTYDQSIIPALVSTIRHIFEIWPQVDVIISATIRNEDTFAAFEDACHHNEFSLVEIDFPVQQVDEQQQLFHSTSTHIKIMHIRAPKSIRDPFRID